MPTTVVINFQHVECLKLTGETTVYVQFASGMAQTFEFTEPTSPASMILAFDNWCDQRIRYGGYVVCIDENGKARAR